MKKLILTLIAAAMLTGCNAQADKDYGDPVLNMVMAGNWDGYLAHMMEGTEAPAVEQVKCMARITYDAMYAQRDGDIIAYIDSDEWAGVVGSTIACMAHFDFDAAFEEAFSNQ